MTVDGWLPIVRHNDGTPDARYSVALEWTGSSGRADGRQYVARWLGVEWLGSADVEADAWKACQNHARALYGA